MSRILQNTHTLRQIIILETVIKIFTVMYRLILTKFYYFYRLPVPQRQLRQDTAHVPARNTFLGCVSRSRTLNFFFSVSLNFFSKVVETPSCFLPFGNIWVQYWVGQVFSVWRHVSGCRSLLSVFGVTPRSGVLPSSRGSPTQPPLVSSPSLCPTSGLLLSLEGPSWDPRAAICPRAALCLVPTLTTAWEQWLPWGAPVLGEGTGCLPQSPARLPRGWTERLPPPHPTPQPEWPLKAFPSEGKRGESWLQPLEGGVLSDPWEWSLKHCPPKMTFYAI